jgi:SanA protein
MYNQTAKENIMKKKIILLTGVTLLIFAVAILSMIHSIQSNGEKYIVKLNELPKNLDAIIVLGAGVKADGSPSDILADRLETSLKVYKAGGSSKFILTGDHGRKEYNEVRAMKNYIKSKGIGDSDIFMDHAGFSTYESMYRARDVFGVKKAVIVTNTYHLPRALYIARKLGIEAYGVSSDIRNYYYIKAYQKREILAQVKSFIDINIFKPLPTFLGKPIPVSTSDGRLTEDEL